MAKWVRLVLVGKTERRRKSGIKISEGLFCSLFRTTAGDCNRFGDLHPHGPMPKVPDQRVHITKSLQSSSCNDGLCSNNRLLPDEISRGGSSGWGISVG